MTHMDKAVDDGEDDEENLSSDDGNKILIKQHTAILEIKSSSIQSKLTLNTLLSIVHLVQLFNERLFIHFLFDVWLHLIY